MYQELYQEVIEYFSYQEFKPEYEASRLEFESKIGKVFVEDAFFETWIETFIEYFTFDRYLPMYGMTPVMLYGKMNTDVLDDAQKKALQQLITSKLCVLQFSRKQDEVFACTDLIAQRPITITGIDRHQEMMLKKRDWLLVRLVWHEEKWVVFGSIWHYPNEIKHILQLNLQRIQNKLSFVHDCMAKKVFSQQYKHVALEKIYTANFENKQVEINHA